MSEDHNAGGGGPTGRAGTSTADLHTPRARDSKPLELLLVATTQASVTSARHRPLRRESVRYCTVTRQTPHGFVAVPAPGPHGEQGPEERGFSSAKPTRLNGSTGIYTGSGNAGHWGGPVGPSRPFPVPAAPHPQQHLIASAWLPLASL